MPKTTKQEPKAETRKAPKAKAPIVKAEEPSEEGALVPVVTDALIDEVAGEVRLLHARSTIAATAAMGKLILDRFYGGSLDVWEEHDDTDVSLRKLADKLKHDADGPSAATILRSIGIYELSTRIDVSAWKRLGVSHLRAVVNLNDDEQKDLLEKAEAAGWTTKQIEDQAKALRKKEGDKRGRPALPEFEKTINSWKRLLNWKKGTKPSPFADLEQIDDLGDDKALELYQTVTGMKLKCEELQKALQPRVKGVG